MMESEFRVICDLCRWWDDRTTGATRTQAVRNARKAGWSVLTEGRAVCKACAPKEGGR